jgi:hypothetical protein
VSTPRGKSFSTLFFCSNSLLTPHDQQADDFNRKGIDPDFSEALIVRGNSTIEDVCDAIHRSLKDSFKYALVWGASAKHIPQRVGLGHVVSDEDVVSIVGTKSGLAAKQ